MIHPNTAYLIRRRRTRLTQLVVGGTASICLIAYMSNTAHKEMLDNATTPILESYVRDHPEDDEAAFRLAFSLSGEAETTRARKIMENLVRRNPRSGKYRFGLGRLKQAAGDVSGSVADYEATTRLDPRLAQARVCIASICSRAGLATEALDEYSRAEAVERNSANDIGGIATAYLALGRVEEAWKRTTAGLTVNPMADQLFPPVIEAGLRLKRYDELEAILIRRLKNQPQYPVYFARGGLIRLIMARSRSEAMLAAAEKIADAGYTPRSAPPEFCAIYSDLMLARHKPDKARRLAEQGLVVNKNDPACLEALSRALRASGDTRKAGQLAARVASLRGETPQITALQRQVTATPGDAGARRALADALAGVRRWGEAHEHYAILARQSPGDRALRDLVAKSRMEAIRRLDTTPESEAAGGPSSGAA